MAYQDEIINAMSIATSKELSLERLTFEERLQLDTLLGRASFHVNDEQEYLAYRTVMDVNADMGMKELKLGIIVKPNDFDPFKSQKN